MRLMYTVCPFVEEARSIAKNLIAEKLIANAHYWPLESIFSFEDSFKEKKEVALLLELPSTKLHEVQARLREMHSYSTPAIIVIKPESVNHKFLQWIHSSTGEPLSEEHPHTS